MKNEQVFNQDGNYAINLGNINIPRKTMIAIILAVSLLAFEMFNFDTTRYALRNLLGEVSFASLQWATILAIAFCSIDFAGLIRLFTPERGLDEPKEVWYLMGAWLLGATMNAIMTWWAVSLTLLNHTFGNEVLSRETLLEVVPIFVAVLVWLTRILFIGAFTVAGEHIFDINRRGRADQPARPSHAMPLRAAPKRERPQPSRPNMPVPARAVKEKPHRAPGNNPSRQPQPKRQRNSRIRQRPPLPNGGIRRVPVSGVQARPRNNRH